jgi:hypothetical protein
MYPHAKRIFVENQEVIAQGFCTLPQWIKSSSEALGSQPEPLVLGVGRVQPVLRP